MSWKENTAMKAVAFMAAVAAFAASATMGWYQLINYDALWGNSSIASGYTIQYLERQDYFNVDNLLDLYEKEAAGEALSVYLEQLKAELESSLSASNTNLRWQLLARKGEVLYGNTTDRRPVKADGAQWYDYDWESEYPQVDCWYHSWEEVQANLGVETAPVVSVEDDWMDALAFCVERYENGDEMTTDLDAVFTDAAGETEILWITLSEDESVAYGPSVRNATTVNKYGYRFSLESGEWEKVDDETGEAENDKVLVLWVDDGLAVEDQYQRAYFALSEWKSAREVRLAITIVCAAVGLLLTICLCVGAGHKRGAEGIYLNWFHRFPGDLLLAAMALIGGLAVMFAFESPLFQAVYYYYIYVPMYVQLLLVGGIVALLAALCMAALITFVVRCKARTLLRNTLIWRLGRWCWHAVGRIDRALPLIWKVVVIGILYVIVCLMFRSLGLWLAATAVVLCYLCVWVYQWKRIRAGTKEILGGNRDYHIDTVHMLPDLKSHADELNNLGHSIAEAVDDRMRSEHFKAELITNVSHDLKTPLTSIINYVDLLKKESIDNPKVAEYIEVLDRKSQRLKKLTEDLVEASKASTGSLTVLQERLDLSQLLDQALAEYQERLEGQRLAVVCTVPEEPVWVEADGRHLWRVIDNLLSNCAKYALEGTRVYLSVEQYADCAVLSVKNISRDALNVPAEQLMERFVRGDTSRTAEGSGLGLSIAQSLTDLQHGKFDISIDGDLFKATVTLPLANREPVK